VLNKAKIKEAKMVEQMIMEIKLQSYMDNPNILKMYGQFHDAKNIYLVLEYCSQCLYRDFKMKVPLLVM
jgi:aurora kinase